MEIRVNALVNEMLSSHRSERPEGIAVSNEEGAASRSRHPAKGALFRAISYVCNAKSISEPRVGVESPKIV